MFRSVLTWLATYLLSLAESYLDRSCDPGVVHSPAVRHGVAKLREDQSSELDCFCGSPWWRACSGSIA